MGRRTTLTAENGTLGTGNGVLAFQTAAAGSAAEIVFITRAELTQRGTATTAMCGASLSKRTIAGTYTVTSLAPVGTQAVGGAASGIAGATALGAGTAQSGSFSSADSGGTYTDLRMFDFANLNGYLWKPDGYGEQIMMPPSSMFVLRFQATPGTTTGWTGALDLDEMA